jgi:hypothetical protein
MSGRVRDAFRRRGHDAWSLDVFPSEASNEWHIQGRIRTGGDAWTDDVLSRDWDLIVAHTPCTRKCMSALRWLHERNLWRELEAECELFNMVRNAPCKHIGCENSKPHPYAEKLIGKPDHSIQPWQFGHREMKETCWWLKNLPPLVPTDIVGPPPKEKTERAKWARVHRMAPSLNRMHMRSRTYLGVAEAIADQWGSYVANNLDQTRGGQRPA